MFCSICKHLDFCLWHLALRVCLPGHKICFPLPQYLNEEKLISGWKNTCRNIFKWWLFSDPPWNGTFLLPPLGIVHGDFRNVVPGVGGQWIHRNSTGGNISVRKGNQQKLPSTLPKSQMSFVVGCMSGLYAGFLGGGVGRVSDITPLPFPSWAACSHPSTHQFQWVKGGGRPSELTRGWLGFGKPAASDTKADRLF